MSTGVKHKTPVTDQVCCDWLGEGDWVSVGQVRVIGNTTGEEGYETRQETRLGGHEKKLPTSLVLQSFVGRGKDVWRWGFMGKRGGGREGSWRIRVPEWA